MIAGEYLATLDPIARQAVLTKASAARDYAAQLPPVALNDAVVRAINNSHVDAIRADPMFQRIYQGRAYSFAYVRPEKLVALQVHVEPRA